MNLYKSVLGWVAGYPGYEMPGALELCKKHGKRDDDGEKFQKMVLKEAFRLSFSSPHKFYKRCGDTRADAVLWQSIGNTVRKNAVAVLGAYDLECAHTCQLLDNMGIPYVLSRNASGNRVEFFEAYSGDMSNVGELQNFFDNGKKILLLIETGLPKDLKLPKEAIVLHFDHHQKGDPGYGMPPERVFHGSSFLQLWVLLQVLYDYPIQKEHLAVALGDHCLDVALGKTLFDPKIRILVLINEIRTTAKRSAPYGESFQQKARFTIALSQARRDFVQALEWIRYDKNLEVLSLGEGVSMVMLGVMDYNSMDFFAAKVALRFIPKPGVILRRIMEEDGRMRFSPMFFYSSGKDGDGYMERIARIGEEEGWKVFGKDKTRGFTLWEGPQGYPENIRDFGKGTISSLLLHTLSLERKVA